MRIHPAASRVAKLAAETPSSFVAFDLLAEGDDDLRRAPVRPSGASALERMLRRAKPPIHLTPSTADPAIAADWFEQFEGAGLDGVIAKPRAGEYRENERAWFKVKHQRTADCVVAGFRTHKDGDGVGSLLLGLYDDEGTLHHVGVASSFAAPLRKKLAKELQPYRKNALEGHPWREWADAQAQEAGGRMPGAPSRWNAKKDMRWEPLRIELVAEVAYEHLQGDRFRHTARFQRWRPDRDPSSCTYEQLEAPVPPELARDLRSVADRESFARGSTGRNPLYLRGSVVTDDRPTGRRDVGVSPRFLLAGGWQRRADRGPGRSRTARR